MYHYITLRCRKYSHLLPYLLLTVVELILFSANFKPGTHLVGWDNLFPEFDFQLNLHRDLHAVWQAYRSLGVIDNMAHASNVILDIMRWLISFFVSTEANRWVYMSCTHLVGGWGMYHLMYRRILAESSNIHERHTPKTTYIFASLCSAFLYQYGLGVIQQYFLPLEVFVHHFAALPWLVYYVLLAFEHGGRKEYFKLALVSLVATPQAHVPTVFIVWGMAFSVLLLNQLLTIQGNKPLAITRILITIVLLFGTNAFWFLPFAYSTITHANIVAASKASQMASNDLFYRNVKYGDLENILQMKGNLLDYGHLNYKTNINHYMFHPWLDHMNMWYGQVAIWFLMISSLFGLFVLLFKKDFKNSRVFAYLLIFTILMLGANIPLISNVQTTLRDHVSLFATVFRAVFTKFSILLNFTYGICFGVGIVYVQNFLQQIFPHKRRLTLHLYFAIVSLSLIVYSLPAFQGAFYYENLGVKIPPQYFSLMKYLKSQDPSKRVLLLPAPWYWQWWQPSWGTINSGFIWHGISQPITELAFTPWSDKNENLYWEFDQAINSNDHHSFEKLLLKYNIGFVMYDESIATHNGKKFDKPEFTTFLSRVSTLRSVFSEESIELYNVIEHTGSASILINPPNITPSYKYGNIDVPFAEIGNYVSSPTFPKTRIYPYRSLFSSQMPNAQEYTISEDSEFIIYESKLQDASNHSLYLNGVAQLKDDAGFQLPIQIWIDGKVLLDTALLEHVSNSGYISDINIQKNSILKVKVKKSDSFIYDAFSDNKFLAQNNNACEYQQNGMRELHRGTHEIRLTSLASENCIKADLPMISGRDAYVFFINTVGDSKRGLYLNFYDRTLDKSGFDTYLPTVVDAHDYRFIKSPQRSDALGYTLYINNRSVGVEKVTNTIKDLRVYKVPFSLLSQMYFFDSLQVQPRFASSNSVKSTCVSGLCQISTPGFDYGESLMIQIDQSFDQGWLAYDLTGANWLQRQMPVLFAGSRRLTDHVLVNNWANGWRLSEIPNSNNQIPNNIQGLNDEMKNNEAGNSGGGVDPGSGSGMTDQRQITVIFWPQYLQYLGFVVLLVTMGVLIMPRHLRVTHKFNCESERLGTIPVV